MLYIHSIKLVEVALSKLLCYRVCQCAHVVQCKSWKIP